MWHCNDRTLMPDVDRGNSRKASSTQRSLPRCGLGRAGPRLAGEGGVLCSVCNWTTVIHEAINV